MELKTYRARSVQDALQMVRDDLGPDAAVVHTRELRGNLVQRLMGIRRVEVTASNRVNVASKYPVAASTPAADSFVAGTEACASHIPPAHEQNYSAQFRNDLKEQLSDLQSMLEDLCRKNEASTAPDLPESLFTLFTDLIDAEISEDLARELVERVRQSVGPHDLDDAVLLKARLTRMVEEEFHVSGPLQVNPGERRLVALVGPTGVGKTTTIAKLAANFHLRERRRVGLITVDTYRIAAVEQLRTYADIIDLPMEVVSTPREMREAVKRLSDLDLVLMDTAGRSPRDEVKIQELRCMLGEAQADEVHLVLSCVSSQENMKKTTARFAGVGVTSLLLTKLDEATGLGHIIPVMRSCQFPLSYVTNGQNVPDDIEPADARRLTRAVLATSGV
jgi:flagellar biosynthesis protein FlhF